VYVFLAIKLATKNDNGVTITTTSVIHTLRLNIKISVPSIVSTPVNACVNPIRSPSANWSASAITLLTTSPDGCPSIYFNGSI